MPPEAVPVEGTPADLMAALQRSVEERESRRAGEPKPRKTTAKKRSPLRPAS